MLVWACRAGGIAVVVGWVMLVGNAILPDEVFLLTPAQSMLLAPASVSGSLALLLRRLQRPVEEVFDAGREYERRRMVREMNRPAKVVPIRRASRGVSEFNRSARV